MCWIILPEDCPNSKLGRELTVVKGDVKSLTLTGRRREDGAKIDSRKNRGGTCE